MLKYLGKQFKDKGLEKWIRYNSESLPVLAKGSIQKATEVFAPIAGKLESVAEAKKVLSYEEVTERLNQMILSSNTARFI